ncbi:MAG: glycosyltransferase [Lentisphaerae bacterium]|nr:glycosyltransferase [Lentisphaerota bacterium]
MSKTAVEKLKTACDYLFLTHRVYHEGKPKAGGIDRTREYFLKQGSGVALMENPLTTYGTECSGDYISRLSISKGGEAHELGNFSVWPKRNPWRWFIEPFQSVVLIRRCLAPGYVCYAGDPLSGWMALRLKRMRLARLVIMHCTDLAPERFQRKWLTGAYTFLYKRVVQESDIVLAVSRSMIEEFRKWNDTREYIWFPNSPMCDQIPLCPQGERNRKHLVLLGPSVGDIDNGMVVKLVQRLHATDSAWKLLVVGGGGGEKHILEEAAKLGIQSAVTAVGPRPWKEALHLVAQSGFGVVFYRGENMFNQCRDSIKIREYAACGLPIICDASTETAREGRDAGACILMNDENDLAEVVATLQNRTVYEEMSQNALKWAKANDKRKYLEELHEEINSRLTVGRNVIRSLP